MSNVTNIQSWNSNLMSFVYNDGGRKEVGFLGEAGDCIVRAIAIATGEDYKSVYNKVNKEAGKAIARKGVPIKLIHKILNDYGFKWTPTMQIGQGCKVHLRKDELPSGVLICRVSKHLVTVNDGFLFDTYDSSRGGTRCVYGYWSK
jgi:hypothetical protein